MVFRRLRPPAAPLGPSRLSDARLPDAAQFRRFAAAAVGPLRHDSDRLPDPTVVSIDELAGGHPLRWRPNARQRQSLNPQARIGEIHATTGIICSSRASFGVGHRGTWLSRLAWSGPPPLFPYVRTCSRHVRVSHIQSEVCDEEVAMPSLRFCL